MHKVHQTKSVREHFVPKNKDELVGFVFVLSTCLQCHSYPSDGNTKQHPWTGITLHSWNPGHVPCTHFTVLSTLLIFCLGAKYKSQACWKSLYSFLLLQLSELLSWIRNHSKTNICSRLQICHFNLQHEKGEVRNNKHTGDFSQRQVRIARYFGLHLPKLFPFFFWSFFLCFLSTYTKDTVCCLGHLKASDLKLPVPDWLILKNFFSAHTHTYTHLALKIIRIHHVLPGYNHKAPSETTTETVLPCYPSHIQQICK